MILVALDAMDTTADKDRNVFEMPYDKGEMLNFALYDLHARIEKLGHHVHRTQRDQYHLPDNRSGIASRANVFAESARVCEAAGLLILLWPICLTGSGAPGCR